MKIVENDKMKLVLSPDYNYKLDKVTGFHARWGRTYEDDPQFSPYGPEILDLEISSGGGCMGNCPFCYKCNGGAAPTYNLTFEQFKTIFHKMPRTLISIAFGIMNIDTNPEFFEMMAYARQHGVMPTYTCHGLDMTEEYARLTAKYCGATAVSVVDREKTFDTVKMLTDAGLLQTNIHYMFSEETYEGAFELVEQVAKDPRTAKLNAIVFLQYKSKGRNPNDYHSVTDLDKYRRLVEHCNKHKVGYGFDSCSAHSFFAVAETLTESEREFMKIVSEPCESALFSSYVNCHGNFFPCSFTEGDLDGWLIGINVLDCENFLRDVWHNDRVVEWRKKLLQKKRECPIYDLSLEKV